MWKPNAKQWVIDLSVYNQEPSKPKKLVLVETFDGTDGIDTHVVYWRMVGSCGLTVVNERFEKAKVCIAHKEVTGYVAGVEAALQQMHSIYRDTPASEYGDLTNLIRRTVKELTALKDAHTGRLMVDEG